MQKKEPKERATNGQKNRDPDPNSKFKNSNGARWGLDGAPLLFSRLQNSKILMAHQWPILMAHRGLY